MIISIHAPRAGCDGDRDPQPPLAVFISIHAPRAGCDFSVSLSGGSEVVFQSTHPVRGATKALSGEVNVVVISIHAPRAGCDPLRLSGGQKGINFNPRTPCGVRLASVVGLPSSSVFQSTHPVRGATSFVLDGREILHISIHAPRAGCDGRICGRPAQLRDFNPRTPCGVRHLHRWNRTRRVIFQSTHPVRGATALEDVFGFDIMISIHAPRAGCDPRRGDPDL